MLVTGLEPCWSTFFPFLIYRNLEKNKVPFPLSAAQLSCNVSCWIGNVLQTCNYSLYCTIQKIVLLVLIDIFSFPIGATGKVPPILWQTLWSFHLFQVSGHSSCPVVPTFQSLQLSGHSSFPVVPIVQSFQLSSRSSFPIVPTLQSFQLSGRSNSPVVLAFRLFQISCLSSFPIVPTFRSFQANPYNWCCQQFSSRCIFVGTSSMNYAVSTGKRKYVLIKSRPK